MIRMLLSLKQCSKYGHLGLFIYTLVETLAPLPPIEILQIPMTLLNPDGWYLYVINIIISSLIGIIIGYYLGYRYGIPLLKKLHVKEKTIDKCASFLKKYDVLAMAIFSFTPLPFTVGIILAGVLRLDKYKYFFTCSIARCLRFFLVGYLTYSFHDKVDVASFSSKMVTLLLLGMGILFVVSYYLIYLIKNHKRKKA